MMAVSRVGFIILVAHFTDLLKVVMNPMSFEAMYHFL